MAILTGIFRKQTGSIGGMTIRQVNGRTITSEKVTRNTSKTLAQMVRRVQLANIINLYRAFSGKLHPSFEGKGAGVSDYNAFVSANFGIVPVYLSKGEARQGGAVVAAYQVTRGSLPSISVTSGTGDVAVTDIALGSLSITASTTLKAFSDAVVNNNSDYEYGDQISAFIATQSVNSDTQVPYVKILALEVTLDGTDEETLLRDLVGAEAFSVADGHLGAGQTVTGAIAYVHSRKTQGGTKVSTQRFLVTNAILPNYQSAAQRAKAVVSYGGTQGEAFLTPDIEDVAAPI
ncbi:MAG: hypothetical protein IKG81_07975 [Bacteroidales bacterium]|nr:hypothetical protein [Bacteroidales bacterium]